MTKQEEEKIDRQLKIDIANLNLNSVQSKLNLISVVQFQIVNHEDYGDCNENGELTKKAKVLIEELKTLFKQYNRLKTKRNRIRKTLSNQ